MAIVVNKNEVRPALRPAVAGDEDFCFDVFTQSRLSGEDFGGFDPAFRDRLLRQQYAWQMAAYRQTYAGVEVDIVSQAGTDIGRLITNRGGASWTLVDIALMPLWRGHGLGTTLIRRMMAEADDADCPLELTVASHNPGAFRLYLRLGFVVTAAEPPFLRLRYDGAAVS